MLHAPTSAPAAGIDPDAALLAACAHGDARAQAQLVERHLVRVHRLAARLLDDAVEAEDVAQELFLRLWQLAPRWRSEQARVSTWIHTVVVNLCRDRLRQRRPQADLDEVSDAVLADAGETRPDAALDRAERGAALAAAIAALPQRQREALLLFHVEGLSQRESAAALGIGEEALESLLARARRSLRAQVSNP
jgi:RNA polymerase sigma-70 factor (ECF subfamily)